ncbi:hypothetical protein D1871_22705 [Nakamurella silvestris]|nr:hypothetical protein D1871_22705 [Nakamurella silvestris]
MFRLVIGAAIGYVLGSRAGRERYEQIKRWSQRAADNPAVQAVAGVARAQASSAVHLVTNKVTAVVKRHG